MRPALVPALTTGLISALLLTASASIADTAPPAFTACAVCHAVKAGATSGGTNLAGVYGRKIAGLPGYNYSDALKAKHGARDDATLEAYITAPATFAPGTKMSFAGQHDAAARKAIIAYLKSLN